MAIFFPRNRIFKFRLKTRIWDEFSAIKADYGLSNSDFLRSLFGLEKAIPFDLTLTVGEVNRQVGLLKHSRGLLGRGTGFFPQSLESQIQKIRTELVKPTEAILKKYQQFVREWQQAFLAEAERSQVALSPPSDDFVPWRMVSRWVGVRLTERQLEAVDSRLALSWLNPQEFLQKSLELHRRHPTIPAQKREELKQYGRFLKQHVSLIQSRTKTAVLQASTSAEERAAMKAGILQKFQGELAEDLSHTIGLLIQFGKTVRQVGEDLAAARQAIMRRFTRRPASLPEA
jgi:hypothetical protein